MLVRVAMQPTAATTMQAGAAVAVQEATAAILSTWIQTTAMQVAAATTIAVTAMQWATAAAIR
jgi:hypothetical protein